MVVGGWVYRTNSRSRRRRHNHMMGSTTSAENNYPIVCDENLMRPKAHGTTETPVMRVLRWGCDYETADRICCFNRHYAEHSGYFTETNFLAEIDRVNETTFYDSVTGKPLFIAPRGRTVEQFIKV